MVSLPDNRGNEERRNKAILTRVKEEVEKHSEIRGRRQVLFLVRLGSFKYSNNLVKPFVQGEGEESQIYNNSGEIAQIKTGSMKQGR